MQSNPIYRRGYIAGYWDGVKDCTSGKAVFDEGKELVKLPVKAMDLSSRATNCLLNYGCTHVENVIQLSNEKIMRMRNLGPETAAEIAHWLVEHGILCSAWSEYL